jgi:hypothetical protein
MRSPSKLPVAPGLFTLLTLAALACGSLMGRPPATLPPSGSARPTATPTSFLGVDPAQALMQTAQAAATQMQAVPGAAVGTAEAAAEQEVPTAVVALQTAQAHATQLQPTVQAALETAQAAIGRFVPTVEALSTQAGNLVQTAQPVGQESAVTVIHTYAQQVLGLSVTVQKAGGLTPDIAPQIHLPPDGASAQNAVSKVAVHTYAALLTGGAGSVSYGTGVVSGDLNVDLNGSSLGAFSFDIGALPTTEVEARALALEVFPGLRLRSFTAEVAPKGYAWKAQGQVAGFEPKTKQATLVTETVLLGILPDESGRSTAYAIIGRGDFSAQLKP